jgi:DNA helicase MCM9
MSAKSYVRRFFVAVDVEAGATVQPPSSCPNNKIKACKGQTFRHMTEEQRHTDFQEIRLQEQTQDLAVGTAPRSMNVIVQDELVDTCQPGGTKPSAVC